MTAVDREALARGTTPAVALTIAGSDSGGGAGIQADLTTFAALGVHGTSVVTALTAQNTAEVVAVHVPPVAFVEQQLDTVLADLPPAATKTGMLATADIVAAVAARARSDELGQLVVDPVLVASSGARLFDDGFAHAYVHDLLPFATVITPNSREAAVLLGRPVDSLRTVDDLAEAAHALAELLRGTGDRPGTGSTAGPKWIVVKGGHLPPGGAGGGATCATRSGNVQNTASVSRAAAPGAPLSSAPPSSAASSETTGSEAASSTATSSTATGSAATSSGPTGSAATGPTVPGDAVDVVLEVATGAVEELRAPWVVTGNDHGTGCTFAAATTALLAQGHSVLDALHGAKAFVHTGLLVAADWRLGSGHGPVAHTHRS